jgi:hypothetical protein
MLWLSPERVELLGASLSGVTMVSVDRVTTRLAEEWSDLGPHVVFADAAEQRVTVTVRRGAQGGEGLLTPAAIRPGAQGTLTLRANPSAGDGKGTSVTASVVVTGVEHGAGAKRGVEQTIRMVAVSSDGALDPISEANSA